MQTYLVRTIFLAFILFCRISNIHADGGTTMTVYAEFTLKDGRNFKAYFDTHSDFLYGKAIESDLKKMRLSNEDCMKAFEYSSSWSSSLLRDSLTYPDSKSKAVYLSLVERKLKPVKSPDYDTNDFWTGIALFFPEDVILVTLEEVQKIKWINCRQSAHYGGIYPTTTGMLDSITNMPYWKTVTYYLENGVVQEFDAVQLGTFHNFFNFNEKYNEAELKRLIHLKYDPNNNPKIREIKNKYLTKGISTLPYEEEDKISKLYRKQISQANAWMWAHGVLVTVHTIGC